MNFYNY